MHPSRLVSATPYKRSPFLRPILLGMFAVAVWLSLWLVVVLLVMTGQEVRWLGANVSDLLHSVPTGTVPALAAAVALQWLALSLVVRHQKVAIVCWAAAYIAALWIWIPLVSNPHYTGAVGVFWVAVITAVLAMQVTRYFLTREPRER